jgi:hypothetical protein
MQTTYHHFDIEHADFNGYGAMIVFILEDNMPIGKFAICKRGHDFKILVPIQRETDGPLEAIAGGSKRRFSVPALSWLIHDDVIKATTPTLEDVQDLRACGIVLGNEWAPNKVLPGPLWDDLQLAEARVKTFHPDAVTHVPTHDGLVKLGS